MLRGLRELLECVLRDAEAQEVPLDRELEFLRLYLAIEQVRFSDRLQPRIAVDASIRRAVVPRFILQPLVENALRHGMTARTPLVLGEDARDFEPFQAELLIALAPRDLREQVLVETAVRAAWRTTRLREVGCGAQLQRDDGTWEPKKC